MPWVDMGRWPLRLGLLMFLATGVIITSARVSDAAPSCEQNSSGVPSARLAALARGFNLSGWFEGDEAAAPDPAVLTALYRRGMTHIRLPVQGELVIPELSSDEKVTETLHRLDEALSRLNAIGFTVSVDLHFGGTFSRFYRDDATAAERMLQTAWTGLAGVMALHPPDRVLADLLNEPEIDPDHWSGVVPRLAAFVRSRLPQTTLIIGPTFWQRPDSLPDFQPLDDLNVVYALHFYDPMVFTHQGHWDPANPLRRIRGLPFPFSSTDAAAARLRRSLSGDDNAAARKELDKALVEGGSAAQIAHGLMPAQAWQAKYHRPLIINEFGVLKGGAPPQSRLRWLGAVVDEAERHCWGWTHWEYAAGFGFINNDGRPDRQTLSALLDRPVANFKSR